MRISFLLYDDAEPIDLAALGVFSMASRVLSDVCYETVAASLAPVVLSNGLRVLPDRDFGSIDPIDTLIVPGGPGWRAAASDRGLLAWLRAQAENATIASICTGAMILAEAGLLAGRYATTKNEVVPPESSPLEELRARHPDVRALQARVVDDGGIVTGGGVSLCIDTALYLLERRFGRAPVAEIERILEYSAAGEANRRRLRSWIPTAPDTA